MDSTLSSTLETYKAACKSLASKESYLVIHVLKLEIELNKTNPDEDHSSLYLAGNNTLLKKDTMKDTPRLDDLDAALIFHTFKQNSLITSLDLRYNKISDDGAKYIGMLLMESNTIVNLNLMNNFLRENGSKYISKALHYNKCLKSLRMNGNCIGDIGGMYFAECLQINNTMEKLDLSNTDLGTESVIAIATALKQNHSLKTLDISRPILYSCQDEVAVHFSRVFNINRGLVELHLSKHNIFDHGLRIMSESLINNLHVTYLDISGNKITRDSMDQLALVLKQNTPLTTIDISFNRIGNEGIIKIANAIEVLNTNLECLNIVNNEITGKGLCALADAMSQNTTLKCVYIWANVFEESACLAFSRLMRSGRLKSENTDVRAFVVDGITKLAEVSHGTDQKWKYWAPSYGQQADKKLVKFIEKSQSTIYIQ